MSPKKVTADDFWSAFNRTWHEEQSGHRVNFESSYENCDATKRTAFMEDPSNGMLFGVMSMLETDLGLQLSFKPEFLGRGGKGLCDVAFVHRNDFFSSFDFTPLYRGDGRADRPEHVFVAIEHESRYWPAAELWNLTRIRAPLKILLLYDWDDVKNSTGREDFIRSAQEYIRRDAAFWPYDDGTEWLFISSGRKSRGHPVYWRGTVVVASDSNRRDLFWPVS